MVNYLIVVISFTSEVYNGLDYGMSGRNHKVLVP